MENDTQFEEHTIVDVTEEESGYELQSESGWSMWANKSDLGDVVPQVGDTMRLYGRGFGYPVRGMMINDYVVRYKTEEQQDQEFQAYLAQERQYRLDRYTELEDNFTERIKQLPQVFQDRINAFREHNPEWGPEFEEYELMVCEDAVRVADRIGTTDGVESFAELPWDRQREMIPTISDGHSGNSFGAMLRFAWLYLHDPSMIPMEHGALCPLVGCADYGCYASRLSGDEE